MKNRNIHTAPTFTEYLYDHIGHPATHIALRARAQYSEFIRDLNSKQHLDRIAESLADYMSEADTLRNSHQSKRAHADTLTAESDRLYMLANSATLNADTRRAYFDRADELSAEAEAIKQSATLDRETAEDAERDHNSRTLSDREDIVHEAITAYLAYMDGKNWSDPDTRAEAFLQAIKSAGAYAHKLASANGATGTSTTVISMTEAEHQSAKRNGESITDEEAEERAKARRDKIRESYGSLDVKLPFRTRGAHLDGYRTIEHRNTPKHKGWYEVTHYKRIAPKPIDDEALNIAIRTDFAENYDLAELVTIGKLSERESAVLEILAEVTAEIEGRFPTKEAEAVAHAGQQAVDAFRAECDERKRACTVQKSRDNIERQFKRRADQIRQTAEVREAFLQCGCTETALDMAISRFRTKLDKATEEATRRATAPMYRQTEARPEAVPTLTAYTNQNMKPTEYSAYTVTWRESGIKPTPYKDMKAYAQEVVHAHTVRAERMSVTAYTALWRIAEHIARNRAELPREIHRAEILNRKAQEAEQRAKEAHQTTSQYSTGDRSEEARQARQTATRARAEAQTARARAKEQEYEVQRMREFISTHTR